MRPLVVKDERMTPRKIEDVLAHYEVGRISGICGGGGTANLNTIVETEAGRFFVRRRNPKYCTEDQLVFDHDLMRHLAEKGVPGPLPLRARDGRTWVGVGGETFELHKFVDGRAHDRSNLEQVKNAARELARFHLAGMDFKTKASKAWPRYDSAALIRAGIAKIAGGISPASKEDLKYVFQQIVVLESKLPDERYDSLPKYVIHGDYHPANMLFRGNEVAGIFDLDWASRQPRMRDIADGVLFYAAERAADIDGADISSLTQAMTYDRERIRLFLRAYHQTMPIGEDEMAVLPQFMRARWLHCRAAGMAKVPEDQSERYFFRQIRAPLQWIEEHEEELSVAP